MNINEFKKILKEEIGKYPSIDKYIEVVEDGGEGSPEGYEQRYRIKLYTDNHVYNISSIESNKKGNSRNYLGCVCSARKPLAGESWTRGCDLSDGDLSIETWNKIKNDIISYELIQIAPKFKSPVDDKITVLKDEDCV
jgi:hypothetical protein